MCVCIRTRPCSHTRADGHTHMVGKEKEDGVVQDWRFDTEGYEGKYQSHRTELERAGWLTKSYPATDVGLQITTTTIISSSNIY